MKALAEALVYAVRHIDARPSTDEDSDVAILESIAKTLHSASAEEKTAFELEAKRLGYPEWSEYLGL